MLVLVLANDVVWPNPVTAVGRRDAGSLRLLVLLEESFVGSVEDNGVDSAANVVLFLLGKVFSLNSDGQSRKLPRAD